MVYGLHRACEGMCWASERRATLGVKHTDCGLYRHLQVNSDCLAGTLAACRCRWLLQVLGVLAMIDSGETDWKVIVISAEDPLAKFVSTGASRHRGERRQCSSFC